MTPLLDVNTLMAIGWQTHEHHARAWRWFQRQESFATCVLTELGFLRVSISLPYYSATPQAVRSVLEGILNRPGHVTFPCDKGVELLDANVPDFGWEHYLAALALSQGGKLAVLERVPIRKGILLIPR